MFGFLSLFSSNPSCLAISLVVPILLSSTDNEIVLSSKSIEHGSPSSIVRVSGSLPSGIENSSIFGIFGLLDIRGVSVLQW